VLSLKPSKGTSLVSNLSMPSNLWASSPFFLFLIPSFRVPSHAQASWILNWCLYILDHHDRCYFLYHPPWLASRTMFSSSCAIHSSDSSLRFFGRRNLLLFERTCIFSPIPGFVVSIRPSWHVSVTSHSSYPEYIIELSKGMAWLYEA